MKTEYVTKQAAIKAVCDSCGVMPDGEKDTCPYKYEGAGCREYDKIIDISPADVRPVVRGVWRFEKQGPEDYEQFWRCSVCADKTYFITNYCHNCGADMRGGDAK